MHPSRRAALVLLAAFSPVGPPLPGYARLGEEEESSQATVRHYHDDEPGRIIRIDESDPAKVGVQVRFPGAPGYFDLWQGVGVTEANTVIFSRIPAKGKHRARNFSQRHGTDRDRLRPRADGAGRRGISR
jgi:hypothetical protein